MCVANFLDFTTPTGQKGNLLNFSSIWGMVLGTLVLLATFSWGQKLANTVQRKVPFVDGTPDAPFTPRVTQQVIQKEVI